MKKKKLVKLALLLLSVAIFLGGLSAVFWKCNQSKNAKLEIASLLEISDVNPKNMRCNWNDGNISIKYNDEYVYYADMLSKKTWLVYDSSVFKHDSKDEIIHEKRKPTEEDLLIIKNIKRVKSGSRAFIEVPLISICTFIGIFIVFRIRNKT
ncbi:MAG: hypothetical protein J6K42_04250 [Clostridia bacterium]|nr:hypothetical protein [Clostridia bacterium]